MKIKACIISVCAILASLVLNGASVPDSVAKEILKDLHTKIMKQEREINSISDRIERIEEIELKIMPHAAETHIEYLKSRMDVVLFVFGLLTLMLTVWNASSIIKIKSFKATIDASSKLIKELEFKTAEATKDIDAFNTAHMNYNARIFNSLAKTFEQVSDSLKLEGSTLSEVTLKARGAYLQTCILYYEQAIKYNLEAGTHDALFSAVHNLASLVERVESHEFSKERHDLKSRLLAKHEWIVTYNEIEESLKKSKCNVNEIATALGCLKILFSKYGKSSCRE